MSSCVLRNKPVDIVAAPAPLRTALPGHYHLLWKSSRLLLYRSLLGSRGGGWEKMIEGVTGSGVSGEREGFKKFKNKPSPSF